ncbi:MAG TPA: alpha/beta hydrolase [Puia sp.]
MNSNQSRRKFLGAAALGLASTQMSFASNAFDPFGATALSAVAPTPGKPVADLGPIKQIDAGPLNIGYVDAGPAEGPVVVLLHGWPYDIHSYADVVPLLTAKGYRVIVPYLRGYGSTRFLDANSVRNGQQTAFAADTIALMDALSIKNAIVGGFDWGARGADIMAVLWPNRVKGIVSVSGYLIANLEANKQPLPPKAELGWWYQYYFATERGRLGYDRNRHDFNKLIWKIASPKWDFDDATFDRSAAAFENPDHVTIVVHNYRWRLSLAPGEPQYDALEEKLVTGPAVTVPAITIGSDFDGANADGKAYAKKFTGKYEHRVLNGIGHNVPQEAPQAFAQAILDVAKF